MSRLQLAAAEDRAVLHQYEAWARQVGLGDAWDHLANDDSPSADLVRHVLGSVAAYLIKSGYERRAS